MKESSGKVWKVGLVGTGYYSAVHLRAWSKMPNVQIRAICDRDPERLAACGKAYGIPAAMQYTDYETMLAEADLDVVDIVTKPDTHLSLVLLAAQAKKHILCQKPFAADILVAREMAEAAKANEVRLMVRENWRWLTAYRQLKRWLDEGVVGTIHAVRYVHRNDLTPGMKPGYQMDQPYFREMPRLLFFEMGAHWFDIWHYLFGRPKRMFAAMHTVSPHIKGEDCGVVVMEHDGFTGFMDVSWASLDEPKGEQILIEGTKGSLKLYPTQKEKPGKIVLIHRDGKQQLLLHEASFDSEESHYLLQNHFLHGLESGEPFVTSAEQNIEVLQMIFAAYESNETKQPVSLRKEIFDK